MNKKQLKALGFKLNKITKKESGGTAFSYFTYDIGDTCFISNENEPYYIELFENDKIKITDFDDLKIIIDLMKKYIIL